MISFVCNGDCFNRFTTQFIHVVFFDASQQWTSKVSSAGGVENQVVSLLREICFVNFDPFFFLEHLFEEGPCVH